MRYSGSGMKIEKDLIHFLANFFIAFLTVKTYLKRFIFELILLANETNNTKVNSFLNISSFLTKNDENSKFYIFSRKAAG